MRPRSELLLERLRVFTIQIDLGTPYDVPCAEDTALADIMQATLMLMYNKRVIGHAE